MSIRHLKKLLLTETICFVSLLCLTQQAGKHFSFSYLMDIVYGGAVLTKETNMIGLVMILLPIVVFPYVFADFLSDDLRTRAPYIFTRTTRRTKWLIRRTAVLFVQSGLFYLVHFFLLFLIALCSGAEFASLCFDGRYILMLFMNVCHIFSLTLIINLFSLKYDSVKAAVSVLAIHLSSCFFFLYILAAQAPGSAFVIPICQFFLFWHESLFLSWLPALFVPGFTIIYSVCYILVLTLLILTVAAIYVRKMDII